MVFNLIIFFETIKSDLVNSRSCQGCHFNASGNIPITSKPETYEFWRMSIFDKFSSRLSVGL